MKHSRYLKIFTVVLTGMIISCQPQVPAGPEMDNIPVPNENAVNQEKTFTTRPFVPFLDGRWIGNAISFGCYREGQAPHVKGPSEEEILEDLNILSKHWNLVRVYGSDDDSERVLKVIHEHQLPMKVMLGIWLENETKRPERKPHNMEQVRRGIELANRFPKEVIAINVGNETQVEWSWHGMEMENLIKYIRTVRESVPQPVTTADDYNFWNKDHSRMVAKEIDFIGLHAYPLWNGKTLEKSVAWIDAIYKSAKAFHPDREIILSETGWATKHDPSKQGPGEEGALVKTEVSVKAQQSFLVEFNKWVEEQQVTVFLFEAFDEPWKGGGLESGPDVMEKHWGVFNEDRTPKESLKAFLNTKKH